MAEGIDRLRLEKNLINAVKEYPEIYAKTDKNYENKLHDKMSWLGISEKLRISTIRCSNMWYSLLQTFLYFARLESKGINTPEALTWPHINAFKEIQPLLLPKYVDMLAFKCNGKPLSSITPSMLDALLAEMELHKNELMSPLVSHIRRQKIWSNIANKLNSLNKLTQLPVFLWQKVWWDLKRRARLRKQLEMKGVYVNSGDIFLSQDLRILQLCGVSPTESDLERIKERLQSCVEIDGDIDSNTCEQCSSLTMTDFSCEKCSNAFDVCMCEVCSKNRSSTCYNINNWSSVAKQLIPLSCQTKKQLLICKACHTALNRKASLEWKVCRFCSQDSTDLENFSSNAYLQVMEIFHRATRIKFSLEDGLPSFICITCKDQLLGFGKLFSNFVAAQTKLRDIHAQLFIGETVSRKRTSISKDLSTLAESNGVTASKKARRISTTSTTTLIATAMDNINLSESPTPTNIGSITISKVSKAASGAVGGPNGSVGTGLGQNLNTPSTSSNSQVTKVSTSSTQIAVAGSNEKKSLASQPRTYASRRYNAQGASRTAPPCQKIISKPCSTASDRNDQNLQSFIRSTLNYEQLNPAVSRRNPIQTTATQAQALRPTIILSSTLSELLNRPPIRVNAFGSMQTTQQPTPVARKPPQRRMTIHKMSQATAMERQLVPAPPSRQPLVADGKSPAQWPLTVQKGSRKPPQRRLTIHNLAAPSPMNSVVPNRSNKPQSDMRATSSQSKIVANTTPTRYYVPLKGGDSPASTKPHPSKTPPPRRMTNHQLADPNCTPQRAMQMTRRYSGAPKDIKEKPSPTERPVPIRERRQTVHNLLTPMSPQMRQPPLRVIETIVIRDDSPPREKTHLPVASSSKTNQTTPKKPPARRKTVSACTSRSLQRTPSPEIIIIPDDSPPKNSNQRQQHNFLGFSRDARMFRQDPNEPLLKTEIALHASLLIDDDDEPDPINPQEDLHVADSALELMTPSGLINYAIHKAYNINMTPPVQQSSKMASNRQTAINQEQPSSSRRSLRSSSKKTPPKTAEATNLRYFRKAK